MKTDKEFVDAVYEKYGRAKAEERRRAARRRRNGFVAALAACLVLFVGIVGVNQMGGFPFNMGGGDSAEPVAEDAERNSVVDDGVTINDTVDDTEKAMDPEATDGNINMESDTVYLTEPYMTDQGLVNEVVGKQGSIKGIELSKSSGHSIDSKFFTDAADISNVVTWLESHADVAMSEATFYANFESETMPETYFVMSVQISNDPADAIDIYVVTDTAPGF